MIHTEHNEKTWAFPFIAYAPEKVEGKLPLIIQLHGAGEWGWGGADLHLTEVHGFSQLLQKKEYPCLVVMPQCPPDSFWAARVESLIEFVRQLKEYFPVDEDRVYLTGLSMGGFGTWFTAMAAPHLFAAIAPVCGGGMAWHADVLKMPIWAFHGDQDDTVNVFHSDDMVNALEKLGANVRYTRLPGVGHNAWDPAYTEELMQWLLAQRRN